ncbi:unnamed protein product [Amoebophrya sp. A25]|nr:unnamed protein product [Amoebophrya sp. A25]|eukprot:GSA25T00000801001.1
MMKTRIWMLLAMTRLSPLVIVMLTVRTVTSSPRRPIVQPLLQETMMRMVILQRAEKKRGVEQTANTTCCVTTTTRITRSRRSQLACGLRPSKFWVSTAHLLDHRVIFLKNHGGTWDWQRGGLIPKQI